MIERERIIEALEKLHIDVVDTMFMDEAIGYNHPGLFYLAKSIDAMANVDAVYFADGWNFARGCKIERRIAEDYGVKILEPEFLFEKPKIGVRDYEAKPMNCENLVLGKHDENGEFRRKCFETYYKGGELSEFIDK